MNKQKALEILGINDNSSQDEIRKAYFGLCRLYHPDSRSLESIAMGMGKEEKDEKIREINSAYEFLTSLQIENRYSNFSLEEQVKELKISLSEVSVENDNLKITIALIQAAILWSSFFNSIVNTILFLTLIKKIKSVKEIGYLKIFKYVFYIVICNYFSFPGFLLIGSIEITIIALSKIRKTVKEIFGKSD